MYIYIYIYIFIYIYIYNCMSYCAVSSPNFNSQKCLAHAFFKSGE